MDTRKLKKYAPESRKDFINAVKTKAVCYGLSEKIAPMEEHGEVVIINGNAFPKIIAKQRRELELRIKDEGFENFIESVAYMWFNRFVAIRYMELHDYLSHGYRVFSHRIAEKKQPEIIEHAEQIELPNLDCDEVIELKLAGNKNNELYQKILLAQCNALHETMPFLFEKVTDGTELLLPSNLLNSDSLTQTLVKEIPEELWSNVEIIGWLYQFYISEKKDEVIGKIVTSEDIPAATQLFTPNWIVKYLVQNTLGKQWLATHPDSNLRNKMEYYIPSTNPENMEMKQVEELTFLDPACGSGHILVEAYHLFKEIYLECGYRKSEIPELILSKNLFGIEIDDRAAQLAAFALMMKAAADDKTILTKKNITPNIITINETNHLDAKLVTQHLNEPNLKTNRAPLPHKKFATIELDEKPLINPKTLVKDKINLADINLLVDLFKNAKTFGTLIRIPKTLPAILETIKNRTEIIEQYGDMNDQEIIAQLKPLIKQTETLAQKFDLVVANPPYMGNKYLNQTLKKFATENYPDTKADLFAMFIERGLEMIFDNGLCGIITMQSWMFLSSFENLRSKLLDKKTIVSLAHFGARAFDTISGDVVSTTAFVLQNKNHVDYKGTYLRLVEGNSETEKIRAIKEVIQNPDCGWLFRASAADFKKIPGSPIAYWVSEKIVKAFENGKPLGEIADVRLGLITSDDERFLRRWYEVSLQRIKFDATTREEVKNSSIKWFPLNKGGDFKKWYGNQEYLVNWENDGNEIRNFMGNNGRLRSRPQNMEYFFKESIGWSLISSVIPAFRFFPSGFIFNAVGPSMFIGEKTMQQKILGFCNTKIATAILKFLNPTVSFPVGSIALLPLILDVESPVVSRLIEIAKQDWDDFETSWDFSENPLVRLSCEMDTES